MQNDLNKNTFMFFFKKKRHTNVETVDLQLRLTSTHPSNLRDTKFNIRILLLRNIFF